MKSPTIVALLVLFAVAVCAEDPEMEGDVLVLTDKTFDEVVNNADLILVEFYAPWCGHCKKLTPEFAEAATKLKKDNVKLAKVDATVETNVASRFGVSGYPTLKIFRKGNQAEYKGPRDASGIVSYMLKQVGDSAKAIKTVEEYNKFIDHYDVSIIGFFPSKTGSLYQNFIATADNLREEFRFGLVTETSVLTELKYGSGIVIVKPFENKKASTYTGIDSTSAISDWVYQNSLALVGEFTKETAPRYQKRNLPIVKVYCEADLKNNAKNTNYFINRVKKAMGDDKKLQEKLQFAVVNKKAFKEEMDKFGLSSDAAVSVAIDDIKSTLKYKMESEFNVENLKAFLADFVAGKIAPYIKSEPIPDNSNEDVKVVVGKNFNDIVLDTTKDVLLEMYAPWCGHCKKLEPVYKELAESLKDNPNVVIAKMDATANDSPHGKYQAKGFPTILYAPANNKDNPVQFSGDRTVQGFTDFLKSKASVKWPKKEKKKDDL